MATTKTYEEERSGYYKVLVGLLILTAVTFVQPTMFLENATFGAQMIIGTIKAWIILMYYMHMKGEKLIGASVIFSLLLVAFFFVIVMIDVNNFQNAESSHITKETGTSVLDRNAADAASKAGLDTPAKH